jgi:hypothetical protein
MNMRNPAILIAVLAVVEHIGFLIYGTMPLIENHRHPTEFPFMLIATFLCYTGVIFNSAFAAIAYWWLRGRPMALYQAAFRTAAAVLAAPGVALLFLEYWSAGFGPDPMGTFLKFLGGLLCPYVLVAIWPSAPAE